MLTFPKQSNLAVFDFVPGRQRFVFVNPSQGTDGGVESVLSEWDGETVKRVGTVAGSPSVALFRQEPPALYPKGLEWQEDGGIASTVIQRFAL
ncbi:hypothetical protein [Corallococcus sp. Z5C101001]|uniref:hypothetical protein n=1 Tax=Corallococcus sp. Z5C101001 TaxID=2596829 RepID=UPI00117EE01B|nr:hypothetical protein [Corallococcus sp. Z5C101001]TSC34443.1 hypothetical protein FOF48_05335 [Corallococcus sp. Z5C101001]